MARPIGYTHLEETKKKIKETNKESAKKRKFDGENNGFYGKNHTNETKEKIKNSEYHKNLKGKNNPNYGNHILKGKPLTPDHCEKIRQSKIGIKNPFYGKKHTKETIDKIKKSTHKHHIYLKENCEKTIDIPIGVHRKLHARAYHYIYEKYGEEGINDYLKWFGEKYYKSIIKAIEKFKEGEKNEKISYK